jgi:hypothetical protein
MFGMSTEREQMRQLVGDNVFDGHIDSQGDGF